MSDTATTSDKQGYDIIGDVHGYADRLRSLLELMGYCESDGAWRHDTRQAVFVGDLIDRGSSQLETLRLVRFSRRAPSRRQSAVFVRPRPAKSFGIDACDTEQGAHDT